MKKTLIALLPAALLQITTGQPVDASKRWLSIRDGISISNSTSFSTELGISPWPTLPYEMEFPKPWDGYLLWIAKTAYFKGHKAGIIPRDVANNLRQFRQHVAEAVTTSNFEKVIAKESFYIGDPIYRQTVEITKRYFVKNLPTNIVLHALDELIEQVQRRDVVALCSVVAVADTTWGNYVISMDFKGLMVGENAQAGSGGSGLSFEADEDDRDGGPLCSSSDSITAVSR